MAGLAVSRKLFINGRFLAGDTTAVNSVARSLTDALFRARTDWQIEVVLPHGLRDVPTPSHWRTRAVGTRTGIAWEQWDLPKIRHQGIVAGFFNTVPMFGQGYVTMLHDAHVFSTPQSYAAPTRLWRQVLSRRAGAAGNYLLTVSQHSRESLLKWRIGSPDRIGVVSNGLGAVGQVRPDSAVLERLGLADDHPYCVALSTLLPHKNIPMLLKTFADPSLAGIRLVLFGKAGRDDFNAVGYAIPDNVCFTGFVDDAELAALYRGSLAVCVPSTDEGFGLPALEGMAHASPAIIAPCGALPEIVAQTGLSAPADDPGSWAQAILSLATDSALRSRLSEQARARASGYTWDAAARATLQHLDRWFSC